MSSEQYGMFFQESEAIARKHPDLLPVVEQIDLHLSQISLPAPLRPGDFSAVLGAEENQVVSVFELLAKKGLLCAEELVECDRCQNLMSAAAFREASDDEDEFECTSCGRVFPARTEPILVYRMTAPTLSRTKAEAQMQNTKTSTTPGTVPVDEPLSERAQLVLVAMLELGATDSDTRKTTEDIAAKALGPGSDPNALKGVMADLKTRQLVESKTGRTGGCWLTDKGRLRATKLRLS